MESDRKQAYDQSVARCLVVNPGDLVVNPMWLTGGSIAVSDRRGAVSPDYRVFRPSSGVWPRYVHHLLRAPAYMDQYRLYTRADTTFDRRVQQEDLDELPLPLPSIARQRRIADFLDDQVARIDNIIAARGRQAVALERLFVREADEAWERSVSEYGVARAAYMLRGMEQGWSPEADARAAAEDEWAVMRAGCVNGGRFDASDHKALPPDLEPRRQYEIRGGDLLMSRASGSRDLIGSVAVVEDHVRSRLLLPDKVYRLFPDTAKATSEYLSMMLRSTAARRVILAGVSGAEGMANNLPASVIKSIPIPAVPLHAQSAASARYQANRDRVSDSIFDLRRSADLLAELKRSLITAAVTGEFNVSTADGSRVSA
jgi:type I restriction enzyme, S subunit